MIGVELFAITFLSLTLMVAIYPVAFIQRAIRQKPPASKTIIDLIYHDCIFFNYSAMFSFSVGVIGCLASDDNSIGFLAAISVALLASVFVWMLTWSLTLSGSLRLISLIRRSEELGIQLLGPGTKTKTFFAYCTLMSSKITSLVFNNNFALLILPHEGINSTAFCPILLFYTNKN